MSIAPPYKNSPVLPLPYIYAIYINTYTHIPIIYNYLIHFV